MMRRRTGPVGAGVLLGCQGVALSRPDRAVGQTDLDARDALIDTDADAKQAQRFEDVRDRRDRWQLLMLGSAHRDGPYPEPTAADSIACAELAGVRPPTRAIARQIVDRVTGESSSSSLTVCSPAS